MKCKHCNSEIADDSLFCEYCGKRVKKKMLWRNALLGGFCMICFIVGIILIRPSGDIPSGYVDLGLPSGTLWKEINEKGDENGHYYYEEAVKQFDGELPSKKQLQELIEVCVWTWDSSGFKITGPSGKSIYLPADGFRSMYGDVRMVGSFCSYWSSKRHIGTDCLWGLEACQKESPEDYGGIRVINYERTCKLSVRLVR